jgi:hypothetical protein
MRFGVLLGSSFAIRNFSSVKLDPTGKSSTLENCPVNVVEPITLSSMGSSIKAVLNCATVNPARMMQIEAEPRKSAIFLRPTKPQPSTRIARLNQDNRVVQMGGEINCDARIK